ncbi:MULTISPECIES: hypothetical protein [unclassified Pseudomonas]|uniref:hypothetical protein n=1 Tax=unclassified Pseudomonas TaxID=196821 RepID=UPI00215F016C|nr:hypothetical protein [Pseudomonas sp. B21-015]UVM52675.1 hypothetical protein LOY38_11905 [Pseudomonas sp. B21-015]
MASYSAARPETLERLSGQLSRTKNSADSLFNMDQVKREISTVQNFMRLTKGASTYQLCIGRLRLIIFRLSVNRYRWKPWRRISFQITD